MDNYQIADAFSLLAKLMDIHGDDPFKSKSYAIAAFQIEKLPAQLASMPPAEAARQKGIGVAIAKKIDELLQTRNPIAAEQLLRKNTGRRYRNAQHKRHWTQKNTYHLEGNGFGIDR
jgi:DNA polymerase (family 10)